MIDTAQISTALQFGDQRAAQLRAILSQRLEQNSGVSERDRQDAENALCNPTALELAISNLQEGCARVKEAVTVIEARFEQRLTVEQEQRFARELWQMASRTGDIVGRVDDEASYAIAMPWTDDAQAARLAQVVQNMAAYAAPDLECAVGHQTLRTAHPRPRISVLHAAGKPASQAPSASRTVADVVSLAGAMRRSRPR